MKPLSLRNFSDHNDISRPPPSARTIKNRASAAFYHGRATFTHRRYPSLSDTGMRYFPRAWPSARKPTASTIDAAFDESRSRIPYVRVISLLAIFAIVAALVANA